MDPLVEGPRLEALWDQINTLLVLLSRTVVQRQLIAFGLVVLLTWLVSDWLKRWLDQRLSRAEEASTEFSIRRRLIRLLRGLEYTLFPLMGLLFCQLAVTLFQGNDWHSGLIVQLLPIFWLLLIYRAMIGLAFTFFDDERTAAYRKHFVRPLFTIFIIIVLVNNFSGALALGDIELLSWSGVVISIASVLTAAFILYFAFSLAWLLRDILALTLPSRVAGGKAIADTLISVGYYAVIAIGILSAVSALGFNLESLTIIAGGISVGIGFGLQDLVNNFVSGVMLLAERTVRPGDVIEVGGQRGIVERMRFRSTMLRRVDNIEVIVPNKTLLSSAFSTYTKSDRIIRRVVTIGVSYDSDPTQVRDLLVKIAESHGQVLKKPPPFVFFADFGPSSLDFQLAVFIDDPTAELKVLSDLRFMIWNTFAKHDIEIPFPQQDVHLYTKKGADFAPEEGVPDAEIIRRETTTNPDPSIPHTKEKTG